MGIAKAYDDMKVDVGLVYVISFLFSYLISLGLGYIFLDNVLYRRESHHMYVVATSSHV
jgi:hypothetical protein